MSVAIGVNASPLKRLLATNGTTSGTAFTQPADRLTRPSLALGDVGVIDFGAGNHNGVIPNGLVIHPLGVGADNTTFKFAVFVWEQVLDDANVTGSKIAYHASIYCSFLCTLSAAVGIVGGAVDATANQRYCDTISLESNFSNANVSVEVISPVGDLAGVVRVDGVGGALLQIKGVINNSATNFNFLTRPI